MLNNSAFCAIMNWLNKSEFDAIFTLPMVDFSPFNQWFVFFLPERSILKVKGGSLWTKSKLENSLPSAEKSQT